jgi:hypothetical protein
MSESDFSKVRQPPQQTTFLDAHRPKFMYHPVKPPCSGLFPKGDRSTRTRMVRDVHPSGISEGQISLEWENCHRQEFG